MPGSPSVLVVERAEQPASTLLRGNIADFWALTKPEVNFLILIATLTGFYLGLSFLFAAVCARSSIG